MTIEQALATAACTMLVGLGAWVFRHTVDRRIHLSDDRPVSEDVLTARLQALEDRLGGRITAVTVRLEDLRQCTRDITRRLEHIGADEHEANSWQRK